MSIETMTKLATVTVGSGGSGSITFSNIPQTYTDLNILVSARSDRALYVDDYRISFNDSTSSFSYRAIYGNGTSVSSLSQSLGVVGVMSAANATASTFGNGSIYISNYTSSNYKSFFTDSVSENNATSAEQWLTGNLWSNTAAITSITIDQGDGSNWLQYSTFTLYGIRNAKRTAGNSIKATGGTITYDGTYVVHTFTSSGTFTPTVGLTADYLVVAGGGGGGSGGGGGAGGMRCTVTATGGGGSLESKLSLIPQSYTVTVGAGGAKAGANITKGDNGSDSAFSTITSTGGGGGGQYDNSSVGNGGSGGGASSQTYPVGTGTANQGYNGGRGWQSANYGNGGGGGAGAVGATLASDTGVGTNGGAGVATSISGSSVTYAGGGGGAGNVGIGTGGSGGGGNGAKYNDYVGTDGSTNLGGGGGGGYYNYRVGGNGGSGIVIIRYKG